MASTKTQDKPGTDLVEQQRDLVAFVDNDRLQHELREILPATVTVQTFTRAMKNAIISDPTGNLAKADRVSLYQAVLRCAMDGLLPDGREAVILPYWDKGTKKHKAQYQTMIGGLRKIAGEFGWALTARVIREHDIFDEDAPEGKLRYKQPRIGIDRGEIIGAQAIAVGRDGRVIGPREMDLDDIAKVRAKSKQPNGELWTTWFDRACEKTVARQVFKEIPWDSKDRERIDRVLASVDELDGDATVDMLYGPAQPGAAAETPSSAAAPVPAPAEPIPDEADDGKGTPVTEGDGDGNENIEDAEFEDLGEGNAEDADAAFEGEEPPLEPQPLTATFGSGQCKGKTVQEVWDSGEAGQQYVKWALKNWKTGDIVADLKAFAEQHPELKT